MDVVGVDKVPRTDCVGGTGDMHLHLTVGPALDRVPSANVANRPYLTVIRSSICVATFLIER